MKIFNPPIKSAAEHLACDEAALLAADAGEVGESLRTWELSKPVVVVGRSTKVEYEVNVEFCKQNSIPILRRCSGGASIVAGAGCLMYSVVLNADRSGGLRKIDAAHEFVMTRVLSAVNSQLPEAELQGTCDVTWKNRKCSGNSLRVARNHLLYHGTILYAADLELLSQCLVNAPRQPDYRAGRDHRAFVTNIPVDAKQFSLDLQNQFSAKTDSADLTYSVLQTRIANLRSERYDNPEWHFRH